MSRRRPTDTSAAAYRRIRPVAPSARARILTVLEQSPATCEHLERTLGLRHQTCSARVAELRQAGRITDTGHRLPTATGSPAIVWAAAPSLTTAQDTP